MTETRRALVLAPMTSELRPLLRYTRARPTDRNGLRCYSARVGATDLVIARVGVGPSMAAEATRRVLELFPVDHVVVSGIAGGLDPSLPVGSVVVPGTVVDLASGRSYRAAPLGNLNPDGTVGVADHLITDRSRLARLQGEGVVALEMESSGVAAVCEEAGLPWTTVRVIGDRPDEGLTDETVMTFLRPDGTADALGGMRFLLTHPARIQGMARLARDSSRAASKAARVALGALGWRDRPGD